MKFFLAGDTLFDGGGRRRRHLCECGGHCFVRTHGRLQLLLRE